MPVRLVCPSCSATLSVKDEYAGRAVKCPKCGGVIPASQPGAAPPPVAAAPPPPPEPEPAAPAFDAPDEPAIPKPKITGRPTGKPVAKSSEDDEMPARRKGRNDDEDDDRPARGRKKRDDGDDEDDRPVKKKGGGGVMIVAIICGTLLLCCGGVGYGIYYAVNRVKEGVEKVKEDLEKWNPGVSQFGYEQLKIGITTRAQAETSLGKGRLATAEDIQKVFPSDAAKTQQWTDKMNDGRAIIWRNGDDYLLVAFHPNADSTGRVQMKEWRPKNGANASAGEPDNAKFLTAHPVLGPNTEVPAEEVSKEYRASSTTADQRYKDKTFIVNGKLKDVMMSQGKLKVTLDGGPSGTGMISDVVHCTLRPGQTPFAYSRGQRIKVSGKCGGGFLGDVNFSDCTIQSGEANPSLFTLKRGHKC